MQKPLIIPIFSGPSCAGKAKIIEGVIAEEPNFRFCVSATDRPARPEDVDGKTYHLWSRERFDEEIGRDGFLEFEGYGGYRYGTLKSEVFPEVPRGLPLLEAELRGHLALRMKLREDHELVSIFIAPPSMEVLERRMRKARGGVLSEEQIEGRLRRAAEEMAFIPRFTRFGSVITNHEGRLEEAIAEALGIIRPYLDAAAS